VPYVHQERFPRLPRLLRSKSPKLHHFHGDEGHRCKGCEATAGVYDASRSTVVHTNSETPSSNLTRSIITPGAITSLTRNVRGTARHGISKQLADPRIGLHCTVLLQSPSQPCNHLLATTLASDRPKSEVPIGEDSWWNLISFCYSLNLGNV
jgi:hypothetical protein